uniref:AB hydrolase-1 domain-containing protein n=1 Tax=Leptobrachium leishanense TaxID=445787 RepID=A0A8C5MYB7_9ANUR
IVVYVTVPFIIRLFPMLLSKVVYLNMVKVPLSVDLSNPGELLNHTINFYLTPEEGITVGVWHTVPTNRGEEAKGKDLRWFEDSLSDNNPVIIYLHGNGGTRLPALYFLCVLQVLSAAGFHVLAFDYRGFADSTGEPSEEGVTQDSAFIYQWVKARSRGNPVCLWGHSLGSGCVSHVVPLLYVRIPSLGHPDVLICVKEMSSPLLILHAEDDEVVPSLLAKKLHETALRSPHSREVKLVLFPAHLGYNHEDIYKDPKLPLIIW